MNLEIGQAVMWKTRNGTTLIGVITRTTSRMACIRYCADGREIYRWVLGQELRPVELGR